MKIILRALLLIITMFCLLEVVVRLPLIRDLLPLPSLGSNHPQFDVKMARIYRLVEDHGKLDCIILGPSGVFRGIDPEVIQKYFSTSSEIPFTCFNFGLAGLAPDAQLVLARSLHEEFELKLLIIGITPIVFVARSQGVVTSKAVLDNVWVKHYMRANSLNGWLSHFSQAFKVYLRIKIWFTSPKYFDRLLKTEQEINTLGYGPTTLKNKLSSPIAFQDVSKMPNKKSRSNWYRFAQSPKIIPERFSDFTTLLGLSSELRIIAFELPVHPNFLKFFPGFIEPRQQVKNQIYISTKNNNVDYIKAPPQILFTDDMWRDHMHLLDPGAQIFSQWLVNKMGERKINLNQ